MEDATAQGFSALRTAGELSWAAQGFAGCDQLLTYERWVDEYFPGRRAIGLCQYDVNAFTPGVLAAVVDAHTFRRSAPVPVTLESASVLAIAGRKSSRKSW